MAYLPSPFKKIETKSAAAQIVPVAVSKPVEAPRVEIKPIPQLEPAPPVVATPAVVVAPMPVPTPPPAPVYPTDHVTIMQQAGVNAADYSAVEYIVTHESGWRYWVRNNEGSGATGLCQALPASKMASAGADYLDNPVTQMRWCNTYAISRYGSWQAAYNYWVAHKFW